MRDKTRTRVTSACISCKQKKTRCEIERPCRHCKRHGWECVPKEASRRGPRKDPTRKKPPTEDRIPSPSSSSSSSSSSIYSYPPFLFQREPFFNNYESTPFLINNNTEPDGCETDLCTKKEKDEELIVNDCESGAEKKKDELLFNEFINYDEEPTESTKMNNNH